LAAVCVHATFAADRPPNILLIFIDDMGWKDATYAGSDLYETPHIDRLAREGMVFTNAYAAAGNCQPSRACLLSGQYTPRHGVYAVSSTKRGPVPQMRVQPIPNTGPLASENVTVAEALRDAGYATAMFGKWHLGWDDDTVPAGQGFAVTDLLRPPPKKKFAQTDDPKWIYRITDGACRFMEANRDRPFFAYVSHFATHMPIQARQATHDRFDAKGPSQQHTDVKYAAMNAQMDDGVGVLLDKLRELSLEDNTLVLFTSDNGALPRSPPTPLRGFKGMYYEGGIRVPMVVRWPGVVEPGSRCDAPAINVDFYPTFLAAAGATVPGGKTLDGESLLPLLAGKGRLRRPAIFWHFPGYLDRPNPGSRDTIFRARPTTVIRKGNWKLHLFHEEWSLDGGRDQLDKNRAVELYNLADDPGESHDLSLVERTKRDELLDDLLAWIDRTNAKLAREPNPLYADQRPN
jgi:arylsulfatase A-like enzyme